MLNPTMQWYESLKSQNFCGTTKREFQGFIVHSFVMVYTSMNWISCSIVLEQSSMHVKNSCKLWQTPWREACRLTLATTSENQHAIYKSKTFHCCVGLLRCLYPLPRFSSSCSLCVTVHWGKDLTAGWSYLHIYRICQAPRGVTGMRAE